MSATFIDKLVEDNKHIINDATIYGVDIAKLSALQSKVMLAIAHRELKKSRTVVLNQSRSI